MRTEAEQRAYKKWVMSPKGKAFRQRQNERKRQKKLIARQTLMLTCVACKETKHVDLFCGNNLYCKQCVAISKYRKCQRCKVEKPRDMFNEKACVCNQCKAEQAEAERKKMEETEAKIWNRNHKEDNGVVMKLCSKCNEWKPLADYYNNQNGNDGKMTYCKRCQYRKPRWNGRTKWADMKEANPILFKKAMTAWDGMKKRCSGKKKCYQGIEVRLKKNDFIPWYIAEVKTFYRNNPYETPSVDRIDSNGHYEVGNIQIISLRENGWKTRSNPRYLATLQQPPTEGEAAGAMPA